MIAGLPPRPTGTSREAIFHQWVWEELQRLRNYGGPNSKVCRTTRGQYTIAQPGGHGGTTTSSLEIFCFLFKSIGQSITTSRKNYLVCRDYDPISRTAGETDIPVAKPQELRQDYDSAVVEGVSVQFQYAARANNLDGQRTVTATNFETQVEIVVPIYRADTTIIYAIKPPDGTGVLDSTGAYIEYLDLNLDARMWAKI